MEFLGVSNKSWKFMLKHLFNCILYMKNNNVIMHDTFMWNWLKSALCDDTLFITLCINDIALVARVYWRKKFLLNT